MKLVESDISLSRLCRFVEQRLREFHYLDGVQLPIILLPAFDSLSLPKEDPCAYKQKTRTILVNGPAFFLRSFECQASALAHEIGHHAHDAALIGRGRHSALLSRCIVADWCACMWGLFDGLKDARLERYGKEYCDLFACCDREGEFFERAVRWYQVFLATPR